MRHLSIVLGAVLIGYGVSRHGSWGAETVARPLPAPRITGEPTGAIANPFEGTNRPIIAIWQDFPGFTADTNYPYLRVALWPDGRVIFARDPNAWKHDLLNGQVSIQATQPIQLLMIVSAVATGSFTGQGRSHHAQALQDESVRRMRSRLDLPSRLIAPPSGQA